MVRYFIMPEIFGEMLGVFANAGTIVLGSLVGLVFRRFISQEIAKKWEVGLGFCTLLIGIHMGLKFQSFLMVVICVVAGGALGTAIHLEDKIHSLSHKLHQVFTKTSESQFGIGFSTSSILFCVGAMAIVGSIQSGVARNHEVLFAKALLDGIASITFSAIYGAGVIFSAVSVFVYQGMLVLLSSKLHFLSEPEIISDISGVGGVLVMMIGSTIAGIRKVPLGDYVPAVIFVLVLSPLFRAFTH